MEEWKKIRQWLFDREDTRIMVVSHRGKFTSSVLENTSLAFLTALHEGADIVEMDLERTKDGILVGHHDHTMIRLFHLDDKIEDHTWEELSALPVYNYLGEINVTGLETFTQILTSLKDKTFLTLDKCWDCWDEVYEQLKQAGMVEQAAFKFYIEDEEASRWAVNHPDCIFLPMVRKAEYLKILDRLRHETMIPAVEIVVRKPEDALFADETIAWLKERHMKVLCNSLSLAKRLVFGAGYDDLKSLTYGGNAGWGVLAEKGIDMIQTDWPMEVDEFLKKIGRR